MKEQIKKWFPNYIGLCEVVFGRKENGELNFPECGSQAEVVYLEMRNLFKEQEPKTMDKKQIEKQFVLEFGGTSLGDNGNNNKRVKQFLFETISAILEEFKVPDSDSHLGEFNKIFNNYLELRAKELGLIN